MVDTAIEHLEDMHHEPINIHLKHRLADTAKSHHPMNRLIVLLFPIFCAMQFGQEKNLIVSCFGHSEQASVR